MPVVFDRLVSMRIETKGFLNALAGSSLPAPGEVC